MSSPEFDEFGTKMLYHTTGQFVDIENDPDPDHEHENGKRFKVNHKFTNYMMIGYFKTGKDQDIILMKTDGPNHDRCNREDGIDTDHTFEEDDLPNCMWYEPHIEIEGEVLLNAEWWHNDGREGLRMDFHKDVDGGIKRQWIGYAVVAYSNQQGERVIEQWCCKNPFDSNDKPTNNWIMNLRSTEKGDGTMFPKEFDDVTINFPRQIPLDFDPKGRQPPRGLEAEIRMNNAKRGTTDMKLSRVYEIIPPTP